MRRINPNKAVRATPTGIIISYANATKSTKIPYSNTLTEQQLYGNARSTTNRYQRVELSPFTDMQWFAYRQALYGLDVYTYKQVKAMDWREKSQILGIQRRAQRVINKLKIDRLNAMTKDLFDKLFWNSQLAKEFVDEKYTTYKDVCHMSFKQLGINKHMIAEKLVEAELLPADFFDKETFAY